MSDLVERLRIAEFYNPTQARDLMVEAADELSRLRALTEWRFDMENAPRDGTIIVLGRPETENDIALSVPGHWQDAFDDGVDYMGSDGGFVDIGLTWFRPGRSFGTESHRYLAVQPTAWLPLLPPPVKP